MNLIQKKALKEVEYLINKLLSLSYEDKNKIVKLCTQEVDVSDKKMIAANARENTAAAQLAKEAYDWLTAISESDNHGR